MPRKNQGENRNLSLIWLGQGNQSPGTPGGAQLLPPVGILTSKVRTAALLPARKTMFKDMFIQLVCSSQALFSSSPNLHTVQGQLDLVAVFSFAFSCAGDLTLNQGSAPALSAPDKSKISNVLKDKEFRICQSLVSPGQKACLPFAPSQHRASVASCIDRTSA